MCPVFFVVGNLYGQDTVQAKGFPNIALEESSGITALFSLSEPTIFSFNKKELHFTPGHKHILITRNKKGTESPYATLLQTTHDGFFIMTSPGK